MLIRSAYNNSSCNLSRNPECIQAALLPVKQVKDDTIIFGYDRADFNVTSSSNGSSTLYDTSRIDEGIALYLLDLAGKNYNTYKYGFLFYVNKRTNQWQCCV